MDKQIKSEELYNRTPRPPQLLALCMRYWLEYRLTGDKRLLHRANHRVITAVDWSVELQFAAAFFAIELELYDNTLDLLERVAGYRGYFKANKPVYFGVYLFLEALIDIRTGKRRAAEKHFKILADFADTENRGDSGAFSLMLGWLRLEDAESEGGIGSKGPAPAVVWRYLVASYADGGRSVFLFERVYRYLMLCVGYGFVTGEVFAAPGGGGLLLAFINWSVSQNLDISRILNVYMDAVIAAGQKTEAREAGASPRTERPDALESIYEAYPEEALLINICLNYISRSDHSERAYRYYRDAESRQLDIPLLHQTLMRSAYNRRIDDIGRHTMERFLHTDFIDNDERLRSYVYHVMLTSPKTYDFIAQYSNEILQFASYCLENGLSGRYYNSIYKYFLENADDGSEITDEYADKAAGILLESIFTYRVKVSSPHIRHIWVIEKEKRDISVYEVHDCEAVVKATSEKFSYVCFSEGVKHIVCSSQPQATEDGLLYEDEDETFEKRADERIKITKMVENADIELYARFYSQGHHTPEILIALARYYMQSDELNADAAGVLKTAADVKGLSTAFKMQLYARLGNYFYDSSEIELARSYYRDVDENYLNDKYIERMLTVFINTDEYQKAAWLVVKKSHCISDRILFQALKKIAREEPGLNEYIAPAAYQLLLRSWYDKMLIDLVIKHYKASQSEWEELNKTLNQLSGPEWGLDELILYNAVWIRQPNAEAQKVFVRMNNVDPENELVGKFAYYMIFELLINNMKPEYDTIDVLEAIFRNHHDSLLAYALSNLYMNHGLTTINSDEILARTLGYMERDGFIPPVFKKNQDKKVRTPYIEKYQTFTYKSLPEKDVRLYYKPGGENEYRWQKMEYLKFGIYYAVVPHFYGEKLFYYYSEEMPTGSITTKEAVIDNSHVYLDEGETDQYFAINNALIYEHMFKYEKVEAIITESLRELRAVRAQLL